MEDFMIIVLILLIANIPAIILFAIGMFVRKKKPDTAKTLFILAGVYLIISLGICASMLNSLNGI